MTDKEKIEKLQDAIVDASNILTLAVRNCANPKTFEDVLEGYKQYGQAILKVHKDIFNPVMQSMLNK